MKCILFILLLWIVPAFAVQSSITVFPLVNKSRERLHDWVAYSIPEFFARKLSGMEGIRIWDPVFMFQTDSSGWRMNSDSLLYLHGSRWNWDAAIGGKYIVENDSVSIDLRIIWVTGTKQHVSMKLSRASKIAGITPLCTELLLNSCALLKVPLTKEDSLWIQDADLLPTAAQQTFTAGYGFELQGFTSEAQTAYNRAIEIAPSFTLARCRSGTLYLRTDNLKKANEVFRNILTIKTHTTSSRAITADFMVDHYPPSRSFSYMEKNKEGLQKSAAGLTAMGKWYLASGEYQRAIALFRRAIAWGTVDLTTDFLLALTYMFSGEYDVASEIFNRLITIRPDYLRYQVSLGAVYRKAGRQMESLAVLEAALRKEPDNVMVLTELARTCFALSWYRKAGQLLEHASRLKPDQYELSIDLGIIYWHEKRFADAEKCFARVAAGKKGYTAFEVNYGTILLLSGNINKAIAIYRKAGRNGRRNPEILYNLAIAYLKKGNRKASARYLDELVQLTPGRTDLLIIRAHLAQLLGKNEDAEMAYKKILENDSYNDAAVEGLIRLLLEEEKYEEAVYQIESYLEVKPARSDLMVLLGDAYRRRGWTEVAMVKYEQVVATYPDYAEGYLGIGRCLYDLFGKKGNTQYDAAIYALKQAESKAPENPEPDDMMGDIYMFYKGYRELALSHWQKAYAKTKDQRQRKMILRKMNGQRKR